MKPISESTLRRMTKNAMYNVIRKKEQEWNALKEWLKNQITSDKSYEDLVTHCLSIQDLIDEKENILSKMQEIESKDFNNMTHIFDNATTIEPFLKYIESRK